MEARTELARYVTDLKSDADAASDAVAAAVKTEDGKAEDDNEDGDDSDEDDEEEQVEPGLDRQIIGGFLELELLSEVRDCAYKFSKTAWTTCPDILKLCFQLVNCLV